MSFPDGYLAPPWIAALHTVLHDDLAYALLLAFGEAFLTGMLITVFVVYRREWVVAFDDAHWLRRS